MAVIKISPEEFIQKQATAPVLDVRSPCEYNHAHIPGANSFPLFTDAERALVGTYYKQHSREYAIKTGLDFFGLKMRKMVEEAEHIVKKYFVSENQSTPTDQTPKEKQTILVHCWRGGMRSAGVAWLLDLYGFQVYTLDGGYKNFRRWVLSQFEKEYPFRLLGGYTGSGKTELLSELKKRGAFVIDFEHLAKHKGSAFGNLGMPAQPTQEHFENMLAVSLFQIMNHNHIQGKEIWVEDESQRIGDVNIPIVLWKNIRKNPIYFLDIPFDERLNYLVEVYGKHEKERMVNAIIRIKKRLGGQETKDAVNALIEDRIADCFRILLRYYDKWYTKGLNNRDNLNALLLKIPCDRVALENTDKLSQ
jgi:tRNA 2-selenouridine synthase